MATQDDVEFPSDFFQWECRSFSANLGTRKFSDVLSELAGVMEEAGYRPAITSFSASIREVLGPLKVNTEPLEKSPLVEIFTSKDSEKAVLVRVPATPLYATGFTYGTSAWLDVLTIARQLPLPAVGNLFQKCGLTLEGDISAPAQERLKRFLPLLGKKGPNGKLLDLEEFRAVLPILYEDEFREDVRKVLNTFEAQPAVSQATLISTDTAKSKGEAQRLVKRLKVPGVATSRFVVYCPNCGDHLLSFNSRSEAKSLASKEGISCPNCEAEGMQIEERFTITEEIRKAIRQGLWLESLTLQTIQSFTPLAWAGQVINSQEIDVYCEYLRNSILVECKDTSFGETDLYVASAKADAVGADLVIVLSTHDIHPNVRDAAEKLDQQSSSKRFMLHGSTSGKKLMTLLRLTLAINREVYLRRWIQDAALPPPEFTLAGF